eukprot:TRINITY_DN20041_c0_g1_i1.p1 TRINITY_DN20041_c0_g1~~TRINITY_DN20041_c0_g1_i1.p1  ORF type:complete len:125 (-),score=7.40 TRINITY_DN20041_c0_g1_i1:27-401(-)
MAAHPPSGSSSKEWRVSMSSYASQLAERYNTGNKYSSSLSGGLNTSLLTSCYASAPVRAGRDAASQSINYTGTRPLNDFITSHFYKGCLLYTSPSPETVLDLVCRLLLEKKKNKIKKTVTKNSS